jgi:hypothetical protein
MFVLFRSLTMFALGTLLKQVSLAALPDPRHMRLLIGWERVYIQHLRTKVHIDVPTSVVLVRFYRGVDADGTRLAVEKNHNKTKLYHLSPTNDGFRFEWKRAN